MSYYGSELLIKISSRQPYCDMSTFQKYEATSANSVRSRWFVSSFTYSSKLKLGGTSPSPPAAASFIPASRTSWKAATPSDKFYNDIERELEPLPRAQRECDAEETLTTTIWLKTWSRSDAATGVCWSHEETAVVHFRVTDEDRYSIVKQAWINLSFYCGGIAAITHLAAL